MLFNATSGANWQKHQLTLKLSIWLLLLLITITVLVINSQKVVLQSGLLQLLPPEQTENNQQALFAQASEQYSQDFSRKFIVSLSAQKLPDAIAAAKQVLALTGNSSLFSFSEPDDNNFDLTDLVAFYQNYHSVLLNDADRQLIANGDYQVLQQQLINDLIQFTHPVVNEVLSSQGSLLLSSYLSQLLDSFANQQLEQGFIYIKSAEQYHVLLLAELDSGDGLSIKQSQHVTSLITDVKQSLAKQMPGIELTASGIVFHTSEAAKRAKFEINTFGLISLTLIVFLVLIAFKRFAPLVIISLTLLVAVMAGVAALTSFSQHIHLITFVLAISLIGISVDYCFHTFCNESSSKYRLDAKLTKALVIGFSTTTVGFLCLFFAELSHIQALAVFIIFGLLATLVTVYCCFPYLLKGSVISPSSIATKAANKLSLFFSHKAFGKIILLVIALVSLPLLWSMQGKWFNDDIRLLSSSSEQLLRQEVFNHNLIKPAWDSRSLMVKATSLEQLLQQEEAVVSQLSKMITTGALVQYSALSSWLPSIKQQQQNFNLLKQAKQAGVFRPLTELTGKALLLSEPPELLTFAQFSQSQAAKLVLPQLLEVEQESQRYYVSVIRLADISEPEVLAELAATSSDIYFFDKAAQVSSALEHFRLQLSTVFIWILIAGMVIFVWRYGVKTGSKAVLLVFASAAVSLAVSFYLQGYLNLFNIIALLLVIVLGIDYTVFYLEKGLNHRVVLAVTLSALSSCFAFGLLVVSQTPAVASIGLTVFLGVTTVYLLAPLIVRNIAVSNDELS